MTESESVALPLGDAPLTNDIITDTSIFVNTFLKVFSLFLKNPEKIRSFRLKKFFSYGIIILAPRKIYPWHSWIARQTPTLKVNGSNPFG